MFGYKGGIDGLVRSLRHHKWPFDIVQEIVISQLVATVDQNMKNNISSQSDFVSSINPQGFDAILTYFEGCWISDYSASYAADAALVQESVTVHATDIIASPSAIYDELNPSLFNDGSRSKIMGVSYNINTGQEIPTPSGSITIGA